MEIKFNHVSYIINKNTPLEKTILNDVDFTIDGPGIYSFIGASNSGKSAIGKLINALYTPSKGSVRVSRYVNSNRGIKNIDKLRFCVGYVYKNPYEMFFNRTVKDELEYAMKYYTKMTKRTTMKILDALTIVGLDESYLNLDPQILTLSDAKKVALACALIINPKILVLDEYTCGITNQDKKDLERLLRLLKNKYEKTIIFITKDTDFVYPVSDQVYIMSLTKIVSVGKKSLLSDEKLMKENNLEPPKISSFINCCNKKGHDIEAYTNIHDLIKGVYRDVF